MKINNNIPAYRFQGYTDAWELRKLGEVGEIERESVNPKLSPNNIFEEYSMPSFDVDRRPAYVLGKDMLSSRLKIQRSSLLINKLNVRQQRIWLVETPSENAICSSEFMPFVSEMVNLEFLREFFLSNETTKKLEELSTGTSNSQNRVSPKDIINFKLAIPSLSEQEAIGTFFSTLDRQITLHQRKLDTLKEQKKTYLKLLFPAKGQTQPALRFQGFEDDWEEVKLGEVVSISSGYTGDATLNNGKYKLTRIETISEGKVDVSRTGFSNELPDEKYRLNFGDILFSNINSLVHIGKVAIFNTMEEVFHGINLLRLVPNKDLINPYFIYYQLVTESKKNWSKAHANQAVNQASINQTSLSTQKISFPTLPEQEAIGTFFSTLDQKIALVEDKLASLKEMKKTLLRKLFV